MSIYRLVQEVNNQTLWKKIETPMSYVKIESAWDFLRSDMRFVSLLERMKLAP